MCRCSEKWQQYAPLALRLVIGVTFILAGWMKIQGGVETTAGFFAGVGIPAATFFAIIVMWLEFLGGIALILGFLTHWVAKLLAIVMVVAIFTVHIKNGFFAPAGVQLPLTLLAGLISLMITGPGKWALDNRLAKDTVG